MLDVKCRTAMARRASGVCVTTAAGPGQWKQLDRFQTGCWKDTGSTLPEIPASLIYFDRTYCRPSPLPVEKAA